MDDNDLCPLCCEELDMSDRQFFPCKCGYQVCMWCWHRIKESESGLCPACRTPYGDDPHEFSAVDMEEVVKANKEKAAAEKREKERLRQEKAAAAGGVMGMGGGAGVAGMHIGGGSDGDFAVATSGGTRGQTDPPKDRNQLANMRVIRRNLVYAVGLPPSIATEEILRKPEHFGQYGKISKIVLNRNHNGNGDPRRASASAYVTFCHKEDALACILALDGFYLDARNIRASYGTSKYCSAFIKNVRCNNPDCTYLHRMGYSDDMFSKQEIQAGYVTSGRDVLAQQQQLAAANSSSNTRRRVGSGGPSGTGKVSSNPVFPPPTYEEPAKSSQTNLVPPPPSTSSTAQFPPVGSSVSRFASTGISGFCTVAAGGKMSRSTSLPTSTISNSALHSTSASSISSNGPNKPEASLTPAELLSRQQEQLRKLHPQNNSTSTTSSTSQKSQTQSNGIDRASSISSIPGNSNTNSSTTQATAASVVAGVHSTNRSGPPPPAPHTTLTALTPLKRSTSVPEKNKQTYSSNDSSQENSVKLSSLRNNSATLNHGVQTNGGGIGPNITNSPGSSISSNNPSISTTKLSSIDNGPIGAGAIGGTVIGNNLSNLGTGVIGSIGPRTNTPIGVGGNINPNVKSMLAKEPRPIKNESIPIDNHLVGGQTIGNFGNQVKKNAVGSDLFSQSLLSSGGDTNQWGFAGQMSNNNNNNRSDRLFGGADNFGTIRGPGIWGNESSENTHIPTGFPPNNNHLGSNPNGLQSQAPGGNGIGMNMSGSSALASMLGIQLPTGVGTLRDSLWASSTPVRSPQTTMKTNSPAPTPIGSGIKKSNKGVLIGGSQIPIGGMHVPPIGNPSSNVGGNTSDIKILQTLLPGVHITSGNAYQPAAPNMHVNNKSNNNFGGMGWGGFGPTQSNNSNNHMQGQPQGMHAPIGVGSLLQRESQPEQGNDLWGGGKVYPAPGAGPANVGNNNQQNGSNIW